MASNEELEARILRMEIAHNELVKSHNTLKSVVGDLLQAVSLVRGCMKSVLGTKW